MKIQRNKARERTAKATAEHILAYFDGYRERDRIYQPFSEGIDIGIILGTGWDVLLKEIDCQTVFPLEELSGFEYLEKAEELGDLEKIEGHERKLVIGYLLSRKVAMLRGRLHVNESHDNNEWMKLVRLQVEMMIKLGVKNLIFTNAVGSLRPRGFWDVLRHLLQPKIRAGDIIAHDGFVTLFAPRRPLWGGEFVEAAKAFKDTNIRKIEKAAQIAGLRCHRGAGAMVSGPDFESMEHDKATLRRSGAKMAQMSVYPEVSVAALYSEDDNYEEELNVFGIGFVSNTDEESGHSHEVNQARAKASEAELGSFLSALVGSIQEV